MAAEKVVGHLQIPCYFLRGMRDPEKTRNLLKVRK